MFKAPTQTPPIGIILDDLPTTDARQIGRHLGVSARTIAHWRASGNAPRIAHLALFWETRWGIALADCEAANGQAVYYGLSQALERECAMLRTRIARLEETGDFGAANSPIWAAR